MEEFKIHPSVYVIDESGNKYQDITLLNSENEYYKKNKYFYILFTLKNDFCEFTYSINATFCTKKHSNYRKYNNHKGYEIAKEFEKIWKNQPFDKIYFPTNRESTTLSSIKIENDFIIFTQIVQSNSGHDTKIIMKLNYDENMKHILKSIAYFFIFIDFTDEEYDDLYDDL